MKPLLTITDVSNIISLGKTTIKRMVLSGEFPKPIDTGIGGQAKCKYLWEESEIVQWLDSLPKAGHVVRFPSVYTIARIIFEGSQDKGIEQDYSGCSWDDLPHDMQRMYASIAHAVVGEFL